MTFELFDPKEEFTITEGRLPHWYQPGVTYFVTFRTEDSVPQTLARSWYGRRNAWLCKNGIDPRGQDWKFQLQAVPELEREFHSRFTREFMEYLDCGYGACVLRVRKLAEEVASALRHFHGDRYELGDFVVMPNHVHLLVCLRGTTEIQKQCNSWKHFSAGKINKLLGVSGRFWQEESFDHLVRSPGQFEKYQIYIAENPLKANLQSGDYLLSSNLHPK